LAIGHTSAVTPVGVACPGWLFGLSGGVVAPDRERWQWSPAYPLARKLLPCNPRYSQSKTYSSIDIKKLLKRYI
jgi:hypothetical protein